MSEPLARFAAGTDTEHPMTLPTQSHQTPPSEPSPSADAFSVIEMLVVVAIMGLLLALGLSVGSSMADAGRKQATLGTLQLLDQTLNDYIDTTGSIPPSIVRIPNAKLNAEVSAIVGNDADAYYPVFDGRIDVEIPNTDPDAPIRHVQVNSIGLYLQSIDSATDMEGLVSHLDNKLARNYDNPDDLQPELLTIFDAWGNPIRYVHPMFDGIVESNRRALGETGDFLAIFDSDPTNGPGFFTRETLPADLNHIPFITGDSQPIARRNKILVVDQEFAKVNLPGEYPLETDSDGGTCPNKRPYFYSAGPDGDPATTQDNIYTIRPTFLDPL